MKRVTFNETGLALTLANFRKLIDFCTGLRDAYKPSRADMLIPILLATHEDATNSIESDRKAFATLTVDGKDRLLVFDGLDKLITRIINALDASGVPAEIVKSARTYQRKIQGKRATPIDEEEVPEETDPKTTVPAEPGPKPKTTRSSSQRLYENRAEFFARLIALLQTQPAYKPNEDDLAIPGLIKKHQAMVAANEKAGGSDAGRAITRLIRKEKFNHPVTGLVALGDDTKKYIKSVFGARSPQYKEVSVLRFRKDID